MFCTINRFHARSREGRDHEINQSAQVLGLGRGGIEGGGNRDSTLLTWGVRRKCWEVRKAKVLKAQRRILRSET